MHRKPGGDFTSTAVMPEQKETVKGGYRRNITSLKHLMQQKFETLQTEPKPSCYENTTV